VDYLALFLPVMTVPGAVLVRLVRLDACPAALSIALSVAVLVLALVLARLAGLGTAGFGYLLLALYAVVAVAAGVMVWRASWRPGARPSGDWGDATPLVVLAAVAVYMLWAGPYTEVPADAWWHLGRINDQLEAVGQGDIGELPDFTQMFDKLAFYWYTLLAYFLYLVGADLDGYLGYLAMGNTLLFSAGVYGFSFRVLERLVGSRSMRHAVAAATVFFFFTHFGISVFSYVRYYAYAPTILSYVVYLAAVACVLRFLQRQHGGYRHLTAAVVLAAVAAMLHLQEAVFIVLMSGAVVLVGFVRVVRRSFNSGVAAGGLGREEQEGRTVALFVLFSAAYLLAHAAAYEAVQRHNPLTHGVMADIRHYVPFLQNLYVLKPTQQFYQVITVWGVLVYGLYIAFRERFAGADFIHAGMLIPLLTVFNPVFTDFFLRFSWPEVLWRMCYMIPLPLVGGYFLFFGIRALREGPTPRARVAGSAMAAGLIVLLLPVSSTFFVSPYSKIHTLRSVQASNDHRLWQDLLAFLRTRDSTWIITDRVTGYVVNGLTSHRYGGYKFYGSARFKIDRQEYDESDFRERSGWLVIVNRRDGGPSRVGRYGGHWPENIMRVSRLYSGEFLEFLQGQPSLFERLWRSDGITVYRVGAT